MTTQRDKLVEEATATNKANAEKEAAYALKRQSDISDYFAEKEAAKKEAAAALAEYESTYGYSGTKQENYAQRYELALDFYLTLDPDVAVKALEASANMKYYLGNNYEKLLSVLKDRTSTTNRYSN